ncbi:MAG TPA: hypothetical protein VF047_03095 [Nitrososphaeraceae archaeon]
MNNYKLIGLSMVMLLTITMISSGFNSAYAHGSKVKVGCKDLAIDLISWNSLYKGVDDDELADIEDDYGDDNDVKPASFDDIIDDHMEDLLDNFEDANCKHIKKSMEEWIEDKVDFER